MDTVPPEERRASSAGGPSRDAVGRRTERIDAVPPVERQAFSGGGGVVDTVPPVERRASSAGRPSRDAVGRQTERIDAVPPVERRAFSGGGPSRNAVGQQTGGMSLADVVPVVERRAQRGCPKGGDRELSRDTTGWRTGETSRHGNDFFQYSIHA